MPDRVESIPELSEVFRETFLARFERKEDREAVRRFGVLVVEMADEAAVVLRADEVALAESPTTAGLRAAVRDLEQAAEALRRIGIEYRHSSLGAEDTRLSILAEDAMPELAKLVERLATASAR